MKKLFLTTALCLAASLTFGQKKALNEAKNEIKGDKPNIAEARTLIKGALEDPETKDQAETWFVAGNIENKQFDLEKTKELIGQQPDEVVMYGALEAILPYFMKADEIDMLPNEKGKQKPKFRKDMKSIMSANRVYYINGGAYYFDKREYEKAYKFFNDYLNIPKLPMFEGEKYVEDSTYIQIKYYAAISASQMQDSKKAIEAYEDLKKYDYKSNEVYQFLCYEYEQIKDTVNLVKTLEEGAKLFPDEPYYLSSLINQYVFSNRYDEAIAKLNEAISKKPQDAQLYDIMGRIYENKKELDKAVECFEKSISLNPNYAEAIGNLGRIYFNQAVEAQAAANDISDNVKYKEAREKAKDLFKKAKPYFEKANQLNPEERDYMVALRGIYYNLDMGAEFDAIDAKLNGQ